MSSEQKPNQMPLGVCKPHAGRQCCVSHLPVQELPGPCLQQSFVVLLSRSPGCPEHRECGFFIGLVVKGMGITYICGLFVSQFQLFLCIFKGLGVFVQLILSGLQLLL